MSESKTKLQIKKTMNIPIFIPHYGCPNDCVFCNQRKISGKQQLDDLEDVEKFILESIESKGNRNDVEIAFFGGSFTGLDKQVQKTYLDIGKKFVDYYQLKGIRMSTRPDYINREIIDFLKSYPVSAIELGVQSLDEEVLEATKRNHSVEDVYQAIRLIKETTIDLGVQMMIGLPKDTIEKATETALKLIGFRPSTIRIYPTLVVKGTQLEEDFHNGTYVPLSLEDAVDQVASILPMFIKAGISVIRVGLQANDGLNSDDLVAGPYHPAFKEVVMDKLIYNEVIDELTTLFGPEDNAYEQYDISVSSNRKLYGRLIGHKKMNLVKFQKLGINIGYDKSIKNDSIQITSIKGGTVFTPCF